MRRFQVSRRVGAACLWAVFLTLSACSVLPESETLTFYRLPSPGSGSSVQALESVRSDAVLRIDTPYGNRAVDSTRILVIPEPERISAYKGARWSDSGPTLFRDHLIDVFRSSGAFRTVVADSSTLSVDLELSGDLTWFHAFYREGMPVVRIEYDATLSDVRSSRVVDSQRFSIEQPVQGKEVPAVVQAFGQATDDLSVRILDWVRDQRVLKANGK